MPRRFSFSKENKRVKESRHVRVEQRTEGDPELTGIQAVVKRLGDDVLDGKISTDEARKRLSSAVERMAVQDSEFCIVCEKPKESRESLVCDACGREVRIERTVRIRIDRSGKE